MAEMQGDNRETSPGARSEAAELSVEPVDHAPSIGGAGLEPPDFKHFWPSLLRAVGAEPRVIEVLRGASGLNHKVIAAGVDEERRRLVVISGEADASSAALAQADIQASINEVKVIVARPALFDIGAVGRAVEQRTGRAALSAQDLKVIRADSDGKPTPAAESFMEEVFGPLIEQIRTARAIGSIGFMQGLGQLMQQLAEADWSAVTDENPTAPLVDLSRLLESDGEQEDSKLGICPLPLYKLEGEELEVIHSGKSAEEIVEILRNHGIFQYFFPPADQTALGLIDRGQGARDDVVSALSSAKEIGHPLGELELVSANTPVTDLIDALQERGYVAEGKAIFEITEAGHQVRQTVQYKPREGFVSKLINRFALKVNIKGLFNIGG